MATECRPVLSRAPAVGNRARAFVLAMLIGVIGGCAALPGIEVDPADPVAGEPGYGVQPITGELIEEIAARNAPDAVPGPSFDLADYQYRVGSGDMLSVVVWNHPELTNPYGEGARAHAAGRLVHQDGTLFFPYVGPIQAAGKTVQQIQDVLAEGLRPYVQQPQVSVRVLDFRSKQMYVTGEVRQPGILPITDQPLTILDAISRAGGFTERVPNQNRYGANARRALLTHNGRTVAVNLLALYRTGANNRILRSGDILHVPDDSDNKVFVLGAVNEPTTVPLHNGELTLAEAIAAAQSIDLATADTEQVYVIRAVPIPDADGEGARIEPRIFQLDARDATALLLADAFPMQPRDVVYVSSAEVVNWNRVMSQILPTIRAGYQLRVIERGFVN